MRRVARRPVEEEAPVRRRRPAEPPPARRRARQPEPEEDPEDEDLEDEEDEEEEEEVDPRGVVRKGWAGYKQTKQAAGYGADFLQLGDGDDAVLIRFLESEPFAAYRSHWIEGLTSTKKKSFVCLEAGCPLCDAGDDPGFKVAFNVLVVSENKPLNKVWEMGPRLTEMLEGKAKDKRTGPLDRADLYWACSRTGKKSKTAYSVDAVKARDLEEDWDIKPLSEATIERYKGKMYDSKVIRVSKVSQLKEIAEELMDLGADDDDDDDD